MLCNVEYVSPRQQGVSQNEVQWEGLTLEETW